MISFTEPPAFATEWCRRLGADPVTLIPLQGGINNQVFRCAVGRHYFVLKGYSTHQANTHDRFKAEVDFLHYARLVAQQYVPTLIYADEVTRSVVLECLEGERFQEGTSPSEGDIDQAVAFMRCLNRDLSPARQMLNCNAAEGFLRLTEHLDNIEQRVSSMGVGHLPGYLKGDAKIVINIIKGQLEGLKQRVGEMIAKGRCEDEIGRAHV